MISALRNLGHELRTDIAAGKAIPACSAGLASGLGLLVAQIAFGSFIFSGPLELYSSQGIGLVLSGNFAACLIIGLAGGFRGSIAGLSPALVAVMATIAASVQVADEALFATVTCVLIISAFATGLGCFLIGRFRLANLVGFIPYPVSSGFVAGLGATVCLAAMSLMGADPALDNLHVIMAPEVLLVWLPGFLYGAALFVAVRRWGNPLILPASFVLAIAGYNLALDLAGLSAAEAGARGLLLAGTADGSLWPPILPSDLPSVNWLAVAGQIPDILILMLVALVCVVMNIAGLELAVDQELDWNHEFRTSGIASMVAGLCGGTVATLIVPASMRAKLLGATTRLTGTIAASVIAAGLFFGSGMIAIIPTSLIGGSGISGSAQRHAAIGDCDHRPDIRRHHPDRGDRGGGGRDAGNPGAVFPASQPRRPGGDPFHVAGPSQQPDPPGTGPCNIAGGRTARPCLQAARLHLLRQRHPADRSSRDHAVGPEPSGLPDAGFFLRDRARFFGRECPRPLHSINRAIRCSGGAERRARAAGVEPEAHSFEGAVVRAGPQGKPGSRARAMRRHHPRRLEDQDRRRRGGPDGPAGPDSRRARAPPGTTDPV